MDSKWDAWLMLEDVNVILALGSLTKESAFGPSLLFASPEFLVVLRFLSPVQGVAAALKKSPPGARCLLWLTALHLLVMGTFPVHVLDVAEGYTKPCGGEDAGSTSSGDSRASCLGLLRWTEDCISTQSAAGRRLAASDELRNATTRTFMSALKDAALLPDESGGGRWAPPFRIPDALIPSTDEAAAARAGGMAPEPGALEGPGLVLALNWLTFCCWGEKGKQLEVRTVALACCRRFQLARPDHPALLAHNLLEHHALKARPLDDIYREISEAFDTKGAAAEAIRDRGEVVFPEELEDGGLTPSGSRLEAVYAFLRFIEARVVSRDVVVAGDSDGDDNGVAASSATSPAKKTALNAEAEAARDREAEATRAVVHRALMSLWVKAAKPTSDGQMTASVPERWLREENGEPLRRAVEGAKASLFRWADGRSNARNMTHDHADTPAMNRMEPRCDYLGAGRQLSVLFAALWVLGGPSTASGALDHLLSADSFSGMPLERRRLSWLHRLEVAIVLSESDVRVSETWLGDGGDRVVHGASRPWPTPVPSSSGSSLVPLPLAWPMQELKTTSHSGRKACTDTRRSKGCAERDLKYAVGP